MAIQSEFYSGDSLKSRTFPSTKHIPTKANMAIFLQLISDNSWEYLDITEYELINNSAVLNNDIDIDIYQTLEVRVADNQDELVKAPIDIAEVASIKTEIQNVASIKGDVVIVSDNMQNVVTTSQNIGDINTLAPISSDITIVASTKSDIEAVVTNAANVTTVADNIGNVNTAATNIGDINTTANDIVAVTNVSNNMPNVVDVSSEPLRQSILDAGTNATNAQVSADAAATSEANAKYFADLAAMDVAQGSIGNINNPLLDLPLNNSLAMKQGVGSVTFTRSTTATYIDRYGVLQTAQIDEPRFEKDGLLIEGSSTNLCLQSSTIDTDLTEWTLGSNTQKNVNVIAPDGSIDAIEYESITDSGNTYVSQEITLTNGTTYTFSMWVRADDPSLLLSTDRIITFRYGTGTVFLTASELSTEWKRLSVTATADDTTGNIYVGYDWDVGGKIQCYGAQIEELPFASSYIPTTDSAVTRGADICEITSNGNVPIANNGLTFLMDCTVQGYYSSRHLIDFSLDPNTAGFIQQYSDSGFTYWNGSTDLTTKNTDMYLSAGLTNRTARIGMIVKNKLPYVIDDGIIIDNSFTREVSISKPDYIKLYQSFCYYKSLRIFDKALTAQEVALA